MEWHLIKYPTISVLFNALLAICLQMAVHWAFFDEFDADDYYDWTLFSIHFLTQLLLYHITFYKTWLGRGRLQPLFNGIPVEDVKAVSSDWIKSSTCTLATPPTKPSIPMYVVFTEDTEGSDRHSFDHVSSFKWWVTAHMLFRQQYILATVRAR